MEEKKKKETKREKEKMYKNEKEGKKETKKETNCGSQTRTPWCTYKQHYHQVTMTKLKTQLHFQI